MAEAVDAFRQALAEEGYDARITHESSELTDTFYASKDIAGETLTYSIDVSHYIQDNNSVEKKIAMAANTIAERFEESLTHRLEWQDREIMIRPYDEPRAICKTCGTEVSLPERPTLFQENAELSTPRPTPVEEATLLDSLDDHARVLLKMYLVGKLENKCAAHCPNNDRKI